MVRGLYLLLGLAMVGLGIVGAFLPLMPSTIFFILAVWFFARSSPRLETWLLNHKRIGPTLVAWQQEGAISDRAKILACSGMALGYAIFWFAVRPDWLLGIGVFLAILACAAYVVSRPRPSLALTGETEIGQP